MRISPIKGLARLVSLGLVPALLFGCAVEADEPFASSNSEVSATEQAEVTPDHERLLEVDTTPPASEALGRALERVRAEAPQDNEVFALITVKDRKTGEKRTLTRGEPRPEYAGYIADPGSAPLGERYGETDDAEADDEVVIARRLITRYFDSTPEEVNEAEVDEIELAERNKDSGLFHRIEDGLWHRVNDGSIDLASNDGVRVIFELRDVPRLHLPKLRDTAVGGLLYTGLDAAAARARAILERKLAMQKLQGPIEAAIQSQGGALTYSSWTAGTVEAVVPARAIDALARRGDVFSVDYNDIDSPDASYQGDDIYTATDAMDYEGSYSGWSGLSSKHALSSRILMGIARPASISTPPRCSRPRPLRRPA